MQWRLHDVVRIYFGMKVCYSTFKMKEHVFHRLAEIFFFPEWWAVEDNLKIS